jgi:hypothetical protein
VDFDVVADSIVSLTLHSRADRNDDLRRLPEFDLGRRNSHPVNELTPANRT